MERIDIIRKRNISLQRAISRREIFGKFDTNVYDSVLSGLITLEDAKLEIGRETKKTPIMELHQSYRGMINRIS